MASINLLSPVIKISSLKALDISKADLKKVPAELRANAEEIWKNQFRIPVVSEPDSVYATVKVNGKTVATLYNSGCAETSNSSSGKLQKLPSMGDGERSVGPELAQKRAEEIAKALGGKIQKASTAKTPANWQPAKVEWTYDYAKMAEAQKERDAEMGAAKNAREAFNASAPTKFHAQMIGQLQDIV